MHVVNPYATSRNIKKLLKQRGINRITSKSLGNLKDKINDMIKDGKIKDMEGFNTCIVKFADDALSRITLKNRITIIEEDIEEILKEM